eukprot:scaffold77621_cov48-Prasinocladus_malaysianus.AAC.2
MQGKQGPAGRRQSSGRQHVLSQVGNRPLSASLKTTLTSELFPGQVQRCNTLSHLMNALYDISNCRWCTVSSCVPVEDLNNQRALPKELPISCLRAKRRLVSTLL